MIESIRATCQHAAHRGGDCFPMTMKNVYKKTDSSKVITNRDLIRWSKAPEIAFTRGQFFTGLEVTQEGISMVHAYVGTTASVSLVAFGILVAVLAFYSFCHIISSVLIS